jgi:hypothetical protein
MLAAAGVWALASLTLPWTRSRRWPALECLRLALWAIALGLATVAAQHLGAPALAANPGTALLGAFVGGLVAFATRRLGAGLRAPPAAKDSPSTS